MLIGLIGKRNVISKGWNYLIVSGVLGIMAHLIIFIPRMIDMKFYFNVVGIYRIIGILSGIIGLHGLYLLATHKMEFTSEI